MASHIPHGDGREGRHDDPRQDDRARAADRETPTPLPGPPPPPTGGPESDDRPLGFPGQPAPPDQPLGFPQAATPPPGAPQAAAPLGGRLHPAVIGIWTFAQLGAVVFLVILQPVSLLFTIPILVLFLVGSAVSWWRFEWRLEDEALVIDQGLFTRKRRVVPFQRIQSVNVFRKLSHRVFRVAGVRVEAVGDNASLDALTPRMAERVREILLARKQGMTGDADGTPRAGETVPGEDGELLASVPRRRLVLAGITEPNATLIAGGLGLLFEFTMNRFGQAESFTQRLIGQAGPVSIAIGLAAIVTIVVALLVLAQALTYWDFTLHRGTGELRTRRGLIEQRFDTIPLRRLQSVRIEENLPRRLLGFAAVKVDVAGSVEPNASSGSNVLLPFGTRAQADDLVRTLLAQGEAVAAPLEAMPRRALRRRIVRAGMVTLLATAAAVPFLETQGLYALLVFAPGLAAAFASYRALGHADIDGVLVTRAGWWVRRTTFTPSGRVQALEEHATVFQRWQHLVTLDLQIARVPGLWSGPRMIDIDREVARDYTLRLAPMMAGLKPAPGREGLHDNGLAHEREADDVVVGGGFEPPKA